ncbi:helix-turn-helix domain-containing protein [Thomasclavelia cocleata]|jgi:transcriptional regulator with XRE-family HTH domain|uniref:helix-turn-helix domain-containing protein n=2 Tax=Thomasclavelia cocleata TaxID=69824 RepID=UPI00241DA009|nr:helix-turn-helix transcriptional regulator [Thomasclavelia cocleata]MCI9130563.1 helix-turn-helix transcriptional regulator [Thomasclavelia cocleata]
MDIGLQIKKFREQQKISQEELAFKIFVSRQTISNWETNKSCPDVKSLIALSNIFNVSLDNFIKEDIEEMREIVEKTTIKKFNVMSFVFLVELIIVTISAYPLFSVDGYTGIIIWLCLFTVALYTASKIERFKKKYDIQTYKEILAFIDGKQLTYDETQQEIGKRNYQKIIFALLAGVIALIVCIIVIFICQYLIN